MSYIGAKPITSEFYYDTFNGDGVTTTFTTTINPGTSVSVIAIVNSVILDPELYYFDGNVIIFVNAPPVGTRNIQLRYLAVPASGIAAPTTYRQVNEFYATLGQTTFNTSYYDLGYVDVYVNGVQLGNDDFQASDRQTVVLQIPARAKDFVRIVSAYNTTLGRNLLYGPNNAVIISHGSAANTLTGVLPGALNNVLISDGTNWTSAPVNLGSATAAYNQANSATTLAQASFNTANTKFDKTGGTISGPVTISNSSDLTVTGNLFVQGATTTITTSSLVLSDPVVYLGINNYTSDTLDIGFAAHYNDGSNAHTGLIRDAGTKEYYFFKGYTPELDANNNVDINNASFSTANVNASYFKGNIISNSVTVNGLNVYSYLTNSFNQSNTISTLAQSSFNVANTATANTIYTQGVDTTQNTNITSTNTFAASAYAQANTGTTLAQAAFNSANAAVTLISGIDSTQNSWITATNTFAASAYAAANSAATNGTTLAQAAFNTANTKVASVTGTTNQVTVSGTTAVTLSLPQSIATGSSVQFGSLGVGVAGSGTTGEIRATNNITAYYSDDRLKTKLGNIENALEKLESLTGFYYEANQTAQDLGYAVRKEVGLSAQDVQKVLPEVVVPAPIDPEKYLTIHYDKVIPLIVEAIKELSAEVKEIKSKI